jgi:hypothetical protein
MTALIAFVGAFVGVAFCLVAWLLVLFVLAWLTR